MNFLLPLNDALLTVARGRVCKAVAESPFPSASHLKADWQLVQHSETELDIGGNLELMLIAETKERKARQMSTG